MDAGEGVYPSDEYRQHTAESALWICAISEGTSFKSLPRIAMSRIALLEPQSYITVVRLRQTATAFCRLSIRRTTTFQLAPTSLRTALTPVSPRMHVCSTSSWMARLRSDEATYCGRVGTGRPLASTRHLGAGSAASSFVDCTTQSYQASFQSSGPGWWACIYDRTPSCPGRPPSRQQTRDAFLSACPYSDEPWSCSVQQ